MRRGAIGWIAYMRALVIAKARVRLAREDLHSQLDYVARLKRELEEAKKAIPVLAGALRDRTLDLRAVHTDRRFPTGHIRGRTLVE